MSESRIVTTYVEIVRHNGATDAVLAAIGTDDEYEIVSELIDTAIDIGLGGDPTSDDAFDRLARRCVAMVPAVAAQLQSS